MTGPEAGAIMLSAGEASGDLHGGTLCLALRELAPELRLFGMGGARMAAAGMQLIADPTRYAVVGTTEAVSRLPALYGAYRALVRRLKRERPRALVLIDFPEFNLRLARQARRAGVPVVYFIPPQLWAWRRGRLRLMARLASRVLAVFPFERPLYEGAGIPVEFVGHPLLDVLPLGLGRDEARRRLGLDGRVPVVGILPGSRREEIARLLPPMLGAAHRLAATDGSRRFLLGLAPAVDRHILDGALGARQPGSPAIQVLEERTHEIMAAADALLIASGTATLEAALLGAPMVVCYRVSRLTAALSRLLIRIQWISLPNIVSGRTVVPEVLQQAVSAERLAAEAQRLLEDPEAAAAQRRAFAELRDRLGEPGVGRRAALAVLRVAGAS
ncbi:MAG: lipid-A-disaccharide synthase [Candidatus Rokubacteria bacterium RIFCSPLOWO2_12_FULL_71_19]|nr:MAG: lipid-A-disaccharide synthase [Candidatus Rokubacteria bacterium RIFCSPLOWO2_12_FULL_71_19]